MVLPAAGQTLVGRIRVRSTGLDPLLARLRAQHLLGATELRPASLPPSAILCVRTMRDPLPGMIDLAGGGSTLPARWERTTVDALERLAGRAARPAREPVPAGAEAVLFADRAELLAQLARDWCEGALAGRWWWRVLFPGDVARSVAPAWLAEPTSIPAALAYLARSGTAARFVTMLEDDVVDGLLAAMTSGFGLTEVRGLAATRRRSDTTLSTAPHAEPPWRPWAPETSAAGLDWRREILLGVGLTLWRAPATIRSPSFAEALRSWSGAEPAGNRLTATAGREATATAAGLERPELPERPRLNPSEQPGALGMSPGAPEVSAPRPTDGSAPGPPLFGAAPATSSAVVGESLPTAGDAGPALLFRTAPATEAAHGSEIPFELAVDTAFGGVFYLINLGIALGLYGDFTMPATPGIPLSPWDFLALTGRRLVGDEIEVDPIWPLLAALAGRTTELPGADFAPPREWRAPPDWLAPYDDTATWTWRIAGDRLQVNHPRSLPVLDLELVSSPFAAGRRLGRATGTHIGRSRARRARRRLGRELAAYGASVRLVPGAPLGPLPPTSPLERWLDWLMPHLRARLRHGLRVEDADLAQVLIRHQARVHVSAVSVDVVLSLADLPIALRLSGLDRDPGWVPAANRGVTFHFE